MTTHQLDTSGLKCPLPVLRLRKTLLALPPGDILEMKATDPGAVADLAAFCQATGNLLLEQRQEGEAFLFRIERSNPNPPNS